MISTKIRIVRVMPAFIAGISVLFVSNGSSPSQPLSRVPVCAGFVG